MTHQLLVPSLDCSPEDPAQALQRCTGLGARLFGTLEEKQPDVFAGLAFFRARRHQTDDVFAVCELESHALAIQWDPDLEVLCLWDEGDRIEIGDWTGDGCDQAVQYIAEYFGRRRAE